jgi:threonine synthase
MWRYRRFLLPQLMPLVTLGEGWTPLSPVEGFGRTIHAKLEMVNPTGSFKDRGASALVSLLAAQAITAVHDDSSGNAGAALAAYAARAGIRARLYVPESASPVKLGQIRLYGAELIAVPGPRSAARTAAEQAGTSESYYASHIDHPFAVFAYKSIAYELWEQLGQRGPDAVVLPLGHGSQLLGLAWGFEDLWQGGLINKLPRLYGVQARACAPLWHAVHPSDVPDEEGSTLAEGIRIGNPVRKERVIEVIRRSEGDVLAVREDDILAGIQEFARRGLAVEPTSAVVWPALRDVSKRLPQQAVIAVALTGTGLKYPGLDRLAQESDAHEGLTVLDSSARKG